MKAARRLAVIGVSLALSGCTLFGNFIYGTFQFGSRDEEGTASGQRERSEASRERAQGDRLSAGGSERQGE